MPAYIGRKDNDIFSAQSPWAVDSARDMRPGNGRRPGGGGGGDFLDRLAQAEARDSHRGTGGGQQQQQQQMAMQQQRQMQQQQQQQMAMPQQRQMQMQQQQQMAMQQQQRQQRRQPSPRPSPRRSDDASAIAKKNRGSSFSLGSDVWGADAATPRNGSRPMRGPSPRRNDVAAGGYVRTSADGHCAPRASTPGGASSISLGSSAWDGSSTSPRNGRGRASPRRGPSPRGYGGSPRGMGGMGGMRTSASPGYSHAAGGRARASPLSGYDQPAANSHLRTSIVLG